MKKTAILLIEDDPSLNALTTLELKRRGYEVDSAKSGEEGCRKIENNPHIVITDLKLGDIDGIEVLRRVKKYDPQTEVIVVTGHGSIDNAVEAIVTARPSEVGGG